MTLEPIERFHVLRKDAQGACILALQKTGILIGLGSVMRWLAGLVQCAPRFYPIVVLYPKPAEPGTKQANALRSRQSLGQRANLDDPPIHIRPICSRRRGFEGQEPNGFSASQHSDNRTDQPRPPPDSSQLLSRVSS